MKKKVFIAHQLRGDMSGNIESAKRWCRWAILTKHVNPIAPYLLLTMILDDKVSSEREHGRLLGEELLLVCDEFWICGPRPPKGSAVWIERQIAMKAEILVVDYTDLTLPDDFH